MAAPATVTTLTLGGKYQFNKWLSGSQDAILRHQGIGWLKRKMLLLANVYLTVKHYTGVDDGFEHIDITQTITGVVPATIENCILNGLVGEAVHGVWGPTLSMTKRLRVEDVQNTFLRESWLADTLEHGAVHSYVCSDTEKSGVTWISEQIWGFQEIEVGSGKKERRHVRHVHFTGPKEENVQIRMVFDYLGP